MKSKDKNTRIKLLKKEMLQSISSLTLWIRIDEDKFKHNPIIEKELLNKINQKFNKIEKEEYTLNLNFKELTSLCNIVAEQCLQYGEDKKIGRQMCKKLENIINDNYKTTFSDICYLIEQWNNYKFDE